MGLKDRLISNGLSVAEVAKAAGTPTGHLYNILNRVRRPRYELALKIEIACNGVIRWQEFFDTQAHHDFPKAS